MSQMFPPGKLPAEFLRRLFQRLPCADPSVRMGPRVGEDAAVIDLGDRYLVAKADPITFATEQIGRYLVHVNANDVACLGARPRWLLVTCLLPEAGSGVALLDDLARDLAAACEELGIVVCGGHTEITLGLDRPVLAGFLLGEVEKERLVDKGRIRPGDRLLLTKGIAVEGTAVIVREKRALLAGRIPEDLLERGAGLLLDPGISVVRDARIAVEAAGGDLHGMHDPTEGGLVQGLHELADRAGVGLRVDRESIPVLAETRAICDLLGIDPMGLLASGALLMAATPAAADRVGDALRSEGIPCAEIGETVSGAEGRHWVSPRREAPLPAFARDELVRVFEEDPPALK